MIVRRSNWLASGCFPESRVGKEQIPQVKELQEIWSCQIKFTPKISEQSCVLYWDIPSLQFCQAVSPHQFGIACFACNTVYVIRTSNGTLHGKMEVREVCSISITTSSILISSHSPSVAGFACLGSAQGRLHRQTLPARACPRPSKAVQTAAASSA